MSSIKVSRVAVDNAILEIVGTVQTEIIDASAASRDRIFNTIENSSGDFIESLKEEIAQEVMTIHAVGELLIALANYTQSAAEAFSGVDMKYRMKEIIRGFNSGH